MTLEISANVMGFDMVFIIGRRLYIYIMKGKGPTIHLCGTPCFIFSQFEEF
jgi:hypothetical protein